ncbi:MAG: diacylglycerol kinase family protein [Candidatus Saccharimonas sp.]
MTKRSVIVVYNPSSGSAVTSRRLHSMCTRAGLRITHLLSLDDTISRKLPPLAKRDVWVLAVGGDGTISAVANILMHTNAILVPLPGGTLNHFTKDLGINQDLATAIRIATKSKARLIDLAEINETYFINNSSIGVYPQSLRTRQRTEDKLGKWPAALWGLLRAFIVYRTYQVQIDQQTYVTPFIFVGNGDYRLEDVAAGGRSKLNAGILSVYIVNSPSRFNLIRIFSRALIGRLHTDRDFTYYTTRQLTINSSSRYIRISHDGESTKLTFPLHYRIHPKSLRIVAP